MNTKRDYDKNPIIIQDNNTLFGFLLIIPIILILIYAYIYNPGGASEGSLARNALIIIPLMMLPYIIPYFKALNKRKIILNNKNITFYHQETIIEQIDINNITEIKKTYSDLYHKSQNKNEDFAYLAVFVIIPLYCYFVNFLIEFVLIFIAYHVVIIILKLAFQIYKTNKFPSRFFDAVLIFEDKKLINILPNTVKEYNNVKEYFFTKNLGDIQKKKVYFEPVLHLYEDIKEIE